MPYNSLNLLRDFVNKLRMEDVDVNNTPEIIITDQDQKQTILQKSTEQDGSVTAASDNKLEEYLSPVRCNGHAIPSGDHAPSVNQTVVPGKTTTRHGSNGIMHFIKEKPLDTTINFTFDPAKDIEKKDGRLSPSLSDHKMRRRPRSLRASFNHQNNTKKCLSVTKKFIASPFGVLCLILVYLSLGACIFMWMERGEETNRRTDLISRRYALTKRLVNCTEHLLDPTECLLKIVKNWEQELVRDFPVLYIHLGDDNSTTPKIWNWPNAFYGCFSVITTIGKSNILHLPTLILTLQLFKNGHDIIKNA